jgi:acyl carrier protein
VGGVIMVDSALIKDFIQSEIIKGKSSEMVKTSDNLIESGIIDSIGIQVLIDFLEKKYSFQIADDEVIPDNFETVDAITDYVKHKKHE